MHLLSVANFDNAKYCGCTEDNLPQCGCCVDLEANYTGITVNELSQRVCKSNGYGVSDLEYLS